MKKITLLFLSSLLLSCTANDETGDQTANNPESDVPVCDAGDLPFTTIDSYFGCPTKFYLDIDLNDTFALIRSQAEFDAMVSYTGDCPINLDLTNYDLVIGKKQLTSGNESVSYHYSTADCITKTLTVTFNQNTAMNAPNVMYHALIPKVSSNEVLEVVTVVN